MALSSYNRPLTMDLAARLRDLRLEAGMTKTSLARPRYTVSYVSQIEAGRRRPSPQALTYFARQLGVSPHYLATGIPEGVEDELRYLMEEARAALREGRGKDAERIAGGAGARAAEYDLPAVANQGRLLVAEALASQGRLRQAIDAVERILENTNCRETADIGSPRMEHLEDEEIGHDIDAGSGIGELA